MGQGRARIYNLISIVFLLLTVAAAALIGVRMAAAPTPVIVAISVPTVAILPSATNTLTWTPTVTSTFTETPTPTETSSITPSITWTLIPSLTPSLTLTPLPPTFTFTPAPTDTIGPSPTLAPTITVAPSLTITNTLVVPPTAIPSETPTLSSFTPQPTEPPPSPFPFVLRDDQVIYTMNFANTAQCAWQGIGGQVFDLNGQPLAQVRVHVFGPGIDLYTASGSNTLYGLSGWEVPLSTTLTSNSYIVELQSVGGTIISPQITVTFVPDCAKNLALVSFSQTRPF